MSRIRSRFADLKARGAKGFIPFVTAGDPDVANSLAIVLKLAELGADVIELGVPFSDPMADGPTIQRSSQRAHVQHVNLPCVIDLAKEVRKLSEVPIVLFSYFNPVLRFGIERFVEAAADAGIDGILFTDVIDAEAKTLSESLAASGIDLISLIAPTTTDARLAKICSESRRFLYAVSRAGITGARESMTSDAERLVARARRLTDVPIAVGFGISTREQVADVWRYADAAVVGSAIVTQIERAPSPDGAVSAVEEFVKGLVPQFANARSET